jgi:hypothetical protein
LAPNASLPEAAAQRMAHLFSKLSISVKNMMKGTEPTSNITRRNRTGLPCAWFVHPGSRGARARVEV